MIAAVIPAGGSGSRFSASRAALPKQYQPLNGQPIYLWSLATICQHPAIQSIVLVVAKDMLQAAEKTLDELSLVGKEKVELTIGGATRQQSVHKGIEKLAEQGTQPEHVIIHDAARPFLTAAMIDETIKCVTANGACTLAVPLTDTIKRVHAGVIQETLDRSSLYLIQTPQAGRFSWLLAAHRQAAAEGFETTDDAAILEYAGHAVSIVFGSRYNLKITNPEDLLISEAIAPIALSQQKSDLRGT
jgi:2-C-methyl-D-erythritol 4-phosphate cytidylyltransferase